MQMAETALIQAEMESQFTESFSLIIQQALEFLPLSHANLLAQDVWQRLHNRSSGESDGDEGTLIMEAFELQYSGQTKRAVQKIEAYKKTLVDGSLELERTLLLQALFYKSGSRSRIKLMEDLLSYAQDDLVLRSALYHLANDAKFQLDDLGADEIDSAGSTASGLGSPLLHAQSYSLVQSGGG